ncbi:MAG: cyclic di-GMP phosphodiesterase [Actinomycetota bacterium]|nr:cyclic di-GMP phosphodiesterase [Actinomycetota bacterium]
MEVSRDRSDGGHHDLVSASVLIVDRHRAVAQSLEAIISSVGGAEVAGSATTAEEALRVSAQLAPDIAIVDLELSPNCSLITALRRVCPDTRIIVMSERSKDEAGRLLKALEAGAVGTLYKEATLEEMTRTITGSSSSTPVIAEEAAGLLLNSYLGAMTEKRMRDLATIETLASAVEVRDHCTGEHLRRVTRLALDCLERIDPALAKNDEVSFGFMLHDVGKIGTPDAILRKPGPLTEDEWTVMRQHPEMGVKIVEPIGFSSTATDIILGHHERWDGLGYPHRLAGEEIPLAARTFAVADAYDAMTSDRPYRPAMDTADALGAIKEVSGKMYDPDIVEVFLDLREREAASAA